MKTIIYTHPYEQSFNHAILTTLQNFFLDNNTESQVIDLYADNFDPVMSKQELSVHSTGETNDPLVKKYQEMIKGSDELIFIFPIWWQTYPAMLKGFIDKVMLRNFAYLAGKDVDWQGLLTNIKKTTVISTSTVTKEYLINDCGDPIQGVFINRTLVDLGIPAEKTNWIHYGKVDLTPESEHIEFLNELPKLYESGQN